MRLGIHQLHREALIFVAVSSLTSQTSEAADKCLAEKRKTINGEDILASMQNLGFDNYTAVLTVYLSKLREVSWRGS